MPEQEYSWLGRRQILSYEELSRLVGVFLGLGVNKVRLTGGEPLLRRDVCDFVALLAEQPAISDLALTTNGVLLAGMAEKLRAAGLHRITVSIDTLREDRFAEISQRRTHPEVIKGIRAAAGEGFDEIKLDTVVMRGFNDDELFDLLEFAKTVPSELRFIEYMDVGGATQWAPDLVFSRAEILESLTGRYGEVTPVRTDSWAPADRYRLPDGQVFGIISSTTQPFCSTCDRSRLTADGVWLLCLYATDGFDLRTPLRDGATDAELSALLKRHWIEREDRGAVDRLRETDRGVFIPLHRLKERPHLEMHTRGG